MTLSKLSISDDEGHREPGVSAIRWSVLLEPASWPLFLYVVALTSFVVLFIVAFVFITPSPLGERAG